MREFEVGKTAVTTDGDEVKLACVVAAFEACGHEWDFIVSARKTVRALRECPIMSR